ncbi:MAG: M1 family peptidase, partial [Bacteroidota bacterium]
MSKNRTYSFIYLLLCSFVCTPFVLLHGQNESNHGYRFEQLGTTLPSANQYRGVDGAPGPDYWQQRCDYDIECSLNTEEQRLDGSELITYYNQSPSTLRYLWLQLDENEHAASTDKHRFNPSKIKSKMSEQDLRMLEPWREQDKYGHKIEAVTDAAGKDLQYTINQTMMRVELPQALKPGESFSFRVKWYYYLIDRINSVSWGRGGYEYFEKDDNYLYTIVQWYPRLCVYSDFEGWQNKQFTGRGEFALTFG